MTMIIYPLPPPGWQKIYITITIIQSPNHTSARRGLEKNNLLKVLLQNIYPGLLFYVRQEKTLTYSFPSHGNDNMFPNPIDQLLPLYSCLTDWVSFPHGTHSHIVAQTFSVHQRMSEHQQWTWSIVSLLLLTVANWGLDGFQFVAN